MNYRAKIEVSLKPGHTDPEGNTTQHLLKELGCIVDAVNVSKVYTIQIEASSAKEAKAQGGGDG
jgi:phosphoribosylformylglycinamidine synthase PurS subunit